MARVQQPAVSVIVPTCARVGRLRLALASIREQSFLDWECWVVNDRRSDADAVRALLDEMGDERFHLISTPGGVGPAAGRNAGLAASSGPIVAFLDDDDRWLPAKLELHVAEHHRFGAPAVVYSQSAHVWEGGLFRPFRDAPGAPPDDLSPALLEERFWPGAGITVSRACFDAVGAFDVDLPCREDQELMLRLARFPFRYVAVLTMVVTEHAVGRLSADPKGLIRALDRFGSSWGVPEIRQRDWVRQRVLMYALIGELDASLTRRIARLHGYGTLARPSGYGWLRWSWWGLRRRPAAALRLLGLALGGRAFCRLNRVLHAADPELERVAGG